MHSKKSSAKRPTCPSCGSNAVIPIVYGMPGGELMDQAEAGKVALGGCCISDNDPDLRCTECGQQWSAEQ
jgi:hypothetical protein